ALQKNAEYRFEVPFSRKVQIQVLTGTAELFGTELAPSTTYTFCGVKAAIYTWHGCTLTVSGEPESEYVAEETEVEVIANIHFALEKLRDQAKTSAGDDGLGPRVLVVGPENAGKTSLVKSLAAYASRAGRAPVVVNLDPRQGMLSVPGSFTAASMTSVLDVEDIAGWGSSPISGPTAIPVKMPLTYHYGSANTESNLSIFKPLITRMALAVTSRMDEDPDVGTTGCIIDTAGSVASGKGLESIHHVISEFSVNVVLVIGSERLYSDLSRRYPAAASDSADAVNVLKLSKSGGCVDRDESYMRQFRQAQIRSYFFGHAGMTLSPFTQTLDYSQLSIYKIIDHTKSTSTSSFLPGDDEGNPYSPDKPYEKVEPAMMLQNRMLAVTHAEPKDSLETVRDSSVIGYVYVSEVDEVKKKVRLLGPVSGRLPNKAMVVGDWPEDVADLVG
ncbi:hypothetical protein LTS18_013768, partial [Coniosporium uncinatum]